MQRSLQPNLDQILDLTSSPMPGGDKPPGIGAPKHLRLFAPWVKHQALGGFSAPACATQAVRKATGLDGEGRVVSNGEVDVEHAEIPQ